MRNNVKFASPKELRKIVNAWTASRVIFEVNDLLVFLDETGNPKLNHVHKVFGIGGCAMFGNEYAGSVRDDWWKIKSDIFGLPANKPFHACEHLREATDKQVDYVARFVADTPFKRFATVVDPATMCDPAASRVDAVLRSVRDQAQQLVSGPVKTDRWFLEHSDDLSRQCIIAMLEHAQFYFHLGSRAEQSLGVSFVPKRLAEPGLEIADLLMYLTGAFHSGSPNFRPVYRAVLAAAFDDRSRGVSSTILMHGPPVTLMTQPDGTLKRADGPAYTVIYPRSGERAERRRKKPGRSTLGT